MATATQTRTRAASGHHHHHDNAYLTSPNKNDAGVRITKIGLYVNLGMAVGKGIGGYVFNSQALSADAIHSLTDLVSDIMTLATVSWSLKAPTSRFPSGYGKVESLGSLGVSSILLSGGMLMGWAAVVALLQQFAPGVAETLAGFGLVGHSHGHDHSHTDLGPSIHAAWLAGGSVLIKEWLYRATMKVAKERKSSVLASNALHHRIDSLTAIVALATIAGANIMSNASWLDPVGCLIISYMIVRGGWENTWAALLELADVGVDEDMRTRVQRAATKALDNLPTPYRQANLEVRHVQGVKSGQNYLMEVEIAVPARWTLDQLTDVEDAVRERVGAKVRGAKRVKVRFVAEEGDLGDFRDEFIGPDVSPRSSPEPEDEHEKHVNGHSHSHDHGHAGNGNGVSKRR